MGKYIIMAAILGLSLLVSHGAQAYGVYCQRTCGPKADGTFWQVTCSCRSCGSNGSPGEGCGVCACGNELTQGGNPLHTGNSALNSGFNSPPPPINKSMINPALAGIDPVIAEERNKLFRNYVFGDARLAENADWQSLLYASRQDMIDDFKAKRAIIEARQDFLVRFFEYPKMRLDHINFNRLGFSNIAEFWAWLDKINEEAFTTH